MNLLNCIEFNHAIDIDSITVANYEYILAFMFNQAGEWTYEVRATGILSTQPIDEGLDVPWGTVVHPGVLAAHHQHIFSLRVDPMLDGYNNRLVYDEAHPMPRSDFNPHGTGYFTQETLIEKSGGYDLDSDANRTFKIQNASVRNPINGKPVAYKIHAPPFQKILSDTDSFNYKRAEFSDHNVYAVKYREDELYSGGKYTNQSRGGTGVRGWADRKDDIVDDDLVVFVQFGINHVSFSTHTLLHEGQKKHIAMPLEVINVVPIFANFANPLSSLTLRSRASKISPSCRARCSKSASSPSTSSRRTRP